MFKFNLASPTKVTIRTYSYAGGPQLDGTQISHGGFNPYVALFNSAGNLIAQQDDNRDDSPPVAVLVDQDPVTDKEYDSYLQISLDPGEYTVSLTQHDNRPAGSTLANGFTRQGDPSFTDIFGCPAKQFCDDTGANRSPAWALDILNVVSATLSPSPNTLTIDRLSVPSRLTIGEAVSRQLSTIGGVTPFSWSRASGALPQGMTLSSAGVLAGTPVQKGNFNFVLRVSDNTGNSSEQTFTTLVDFVPPPPDVRIYKAGTTTVPGRDIEYFIIVQNKGNAPVFNVKVNELLDLSQFSYISSNPIAEVFTSDSYPNTVSLLIWTIPELQPEQISRLNYVAKLKPGLPLGTRVVGGPACRDVDSDKLRACLNDLISTATACTLCGPLCAIGVTNPAAVVGCVACVVNCIANFPKIQRCYDIASQDCSSDEQNATQPVDPNEKLAAPKKFIQPDQRLTYPIHFENIGAVEARDVFVTDILNPNLDISTLNFLTQEGASFDRQTRTIRWNLLGRNLQPGKTDNVVFAINPIANLPSGTEIRNAATIQFEIFPPLTTAEVLNVIDSTAPTCTMKPLPAESATEEFEISWSGRDQVGEIDHYSVFVAEGGGGFVPLLEKTTETMVRFTGQRGKTYGFLCAAKDTAGNVEDAQATPETSTMVTGVAANKPPIASAGLDQTVQCTGQGGASVTLNGSGSSDPDNDPLTYTWAGTFGTVNGVTPTVPCPMGTSTITLTVSDGKGGTAGDTVIVKVVDSTPPVIQSAAANPNTLWPPNHKMVPVTVTASAKDLCSATTTCRIVTVSSNEPINGTGDGDTAPDWQITGPLTANLRAERAGSGTGRVYTIAVQCTDAAGNSGTKNVTVTVPHNQ